MRYAIGKLVSLCIICPCVIGLYAAPAGQNGKYEHSARSGSLNTKVANYTLNAEDGTHALASAADKFGLSLGMEVGEQPTGAVSIHVESGTAGDVFSAIVSQMPGYTWSSEDGVVDVFPTNHPDSVLDVHVNHFHVKDATYIDIPGAIASLPEVRAWLAKNGLAERSPISVVAASDAMTGQLALPRVSLDVDNATLRQVMNRIVRQPGWNGWSVSTYGNANQYFNIQVR
jgi:hypothetical protein